MTTTRNRVNGANVPQLHISHCTCGDIECVEDLVSRLRKALAFIAADKKLTVDHLRGYADGVLKGLASMDEGRNEAAVLDCGCGLGPRCGEKNAALRTHKP